MYEPKFSADKSYLISYQCGYSSFDIMIVDLATDRKLIYSLGGGKFELQNINLIKRDDYRKKQILIDLKQIINYNEDYYKIDEKVRNLKLLIQ